jgi:hypothetical protein
MYLALVLLNIFKIILAISSHRGLSTIQSVIFGCRFKLSKAKRYQDNTKSLKSIASHLETLALRPFYYPISIKKVKNNFK